MLFIKFLNSALLAHKQLLKNASVMAITLAAVLSIPACGNKTDAEEELESDIELPAQQSS